MARNVSDLQTRVQQRIDELVASGQETGIQVAARLHGEVIVDACAGVADRATGRPVTPDTPFFSYSMGKGVAATVVHVLVEQGKLDYDLRIADVWPEFAQHGKGAATLRHALAHAAGVPALPADTTPEDFADWDRMCAVVAGSEPVWEPGTANGYHAWTFGWLVGEVVRRATGRTVSEVLAEAVAGPLGVPGELFFAVPDADLPRLARLADRDWSAVLDLLDAQVPNFGRVLPRAVRPSAELANRRDILQAEILAAGTVSARAVAKMYAALLTEVDGVRLISPERLREVTAVATQGPDWTFGQEIPKGLGYGLDPDGTWFGSSGVGGSIAYAFPGLGLTVAATKNMLAFGADDPMEDLRALIQEAVA